MKKFFSLGLLLMITLLFCQVNIDEIKKQVTENPQQYYFENLELFKTDPESLSQDQLNYIYYGNNYVDYGYKRDVFNKKLSEITKVVTRKSSPKLSQQVLKEARSLFSENPINKDLLNNMSILSERVGDKKNSEMYALQRRLLLETIQNSGTGLSVESPVVVTHFKDQFVALEEFSTIFVPGISFDSKLLPDGSWLNIYKNGLDLYFIKTVHHKDFLKDD